MRKSFLGLAFLLGAFATVKAQTDAKATEVLEALLEKTKAYTTLDVDFTYSMQNTDLKIDETYSGNVKIKGSKYKVTLSTQEIFCDDSTVTTYNSETNEATVINVADLEMGALSPQSLFTMYESGFKSKLKSEEVEGTSTIVTIDLYPISPKEKDYSIIRLEIDKTKMEIRKAIVKGKNGTIYIYLVSKLTGNTTIDDSTFVFDETKYPGVTVIK